MTAQHVVEGIKDGSIISLFYKGEWHSGPVRVIGLGSSEKENADVAVLSIEQRISPPLPLNATTADVIFGQDLFFLGFPYGLYTDTDIMKGFPLPLIKKAVLSGSLRQGGKTEVFLLDGHNNPGCSGGPVVFKPGNKPNAEYRVLGLISAYRLEEQDVYFNRKPTGLKHAENAGIILAPAIKIATDMIESNPIGLALT